MCRGPARLPQLDAHRRELLFRRFGPAAVGVRAGGTGVEDGPDAFRVEAGVFEGGLRAFLGEFADADDPLGREVVDGGAQGVVAGGLEGGALGGG